MRNTFARMLLFSLEGSEGQMDQKCRHSQSHFPLSSIHLVNILNAKGLQINVGTRVTYHLDLNSLRGRHCKYDLVSGEVTTELFAS